MRPARVILAAFALFAGGCQSAPVARPAAPAAPAGGAVSAADPRAAEAGLAILAQGGSATDAAIAVMLALTVVEPQSSGIGGGGFLVHATPDGAVHTIDGRETAPAAAGPDWFLTPDGAPRPYAEVVGTGLSVGVPGNIALAAEAHRRSGRLPWRALFAPAIALARDGFVMNRRLHASLSDAGTRSNSTAAGRALYRDARGAPVAVGARVRNPALARTLERLSRQGPAEFYRGATAAGIVATVRAATPGERSMTASDLATYRAARRAPVCGTYRAYRICGMGPPSSGGIAVVQILGQLERFDLRGLGVRNPVTWHLFTESQRLAYADRELYVADSDFVAVPVAGLIAPDYLARRAALIAPDRRMPQAPAGQPAGAVTSVRAGHAAPEHGTSHFAVVDAGGTMVSYTSTIEAAFGSGLVTNGFFLNNELTDFSFAPERDGVPVANRVEGGKRPRSSMAPMVIYDPAGEPFMVIGAAGGPTIPVQTARAIIGVIDFQLPAREALGLPFLMTSGDTLLVEQGTWLAELVPALQRLGHSRTVVRDVGLKANALVRSSEGWVAASDPRLDQALATTP
ncbi:gamma-glutamyltransferase [Erythrobacteraceae bacterium CFH 75059]|uniref:gamma-glutamyltransferase n=1 Tax=Qipengyuania thermophila TaxID=2509361 RepID=UPI001021D9C2|nr:gamma-glutamyltransferase [Qipengyuania thermophila]TCD06620.1 gamma-glutamyltransferase [Erythrobacteraceae bacterium CFH 75059]